MGTNTIILLVLAGLLVLSLPIWKYTRVWGGGYTPPLIVAFMLGANLFAMLVPAGK